MELRKHLEFRHVRTGEWLYDDLTFKDWIDKNSNTALWYHAGPGSGKLPLSRPGRQEADPVGQAKLS